MTAAYLLTQKGNSVIVIDDGPIGGGMTARTTGELATMPGSRWQDIEKLHGLEAAQLAARSHASAIDAIEGIARRETIECDFERLDGFLLPGSDDECTAAVRAGIEGVEVVDKAPIAGDTGRCVRFPQQAQFHPLKYLAGLARGIERDRGVIHCGTHAEQVQGGKSPFVRTREGYRIDCKAVVVAADDPPGERPGAHARLVPHLTHVIAARVPRGTVARALLRDTVLPNHSVRVIPDPGPHGEILLVSGTDQPPGETHDCAERFAVLELWMRERYPMAREILHRWSARAMMTHDHLALIGRNPGDAHVYVATGDCGARLTHGTIAGLVITDLIHGAEIPWAGLYDPLRSARQINRVAPARSSRGGARARRASI
jgi:glycine/D-amino acid oxidase-like deaminating enzyme